ncbi:MAG: methyltransferase domain-containing protein [Opitutales bacterium]|nr:methyltransferase domain-containing protein [Opitutales bacterium]
MGDDYAAYLEERSARVVRLRSWIAAELGGADAVTLEFGCGHGHFLAGYAAERPEEWCVGLDLRTRRIRLAEAKARKRGLDRTRFVKAEAMEFLDALEGGPRVGRAFMLFPDPWPKKRHRKHRMLQAAFLARLADLAAPGACLHFRTDHAENFAWALEQVAEHPRWTLRPDAPWPHETGTYFQEVTGGRYQSFTAQASK